jgi:hypothetical protein
VLRGDIHLGPNGAYIGGTDHLQVHGQIYGGDLNLGRRRGTPGLVATSGPLAYTGASRIFSGEFILAESGKLSETSGVELYPEGNLLVDSRPGDGPLTDRVADDVPIRMHGGELSAWPTDWGVNSKERVGQIILERGVSVVRGTHFFQNSRQSHTDLIVGEIVRKTGAILAVTTVMRRASSPFTFGQTFPSESDLLLENGPPLVNGILPAWINYRTAFATYRNGRVASYEGPFVDMATSGPTSIVRPGQGTTTLAVDKTIHALYAFGNAGPVNLGGHTLTVGSGGISGATMSNGFVRPGALANGELIFFGGSTINATIEDNGGPTSVVYAGEAEIGGVNTYTGTTYVVGDAGDTVTVTNFEALPPGGSIQIGGYAELNLRDLSGNSAYVLGDVAIRDGGSMIASCCGNGDTVAARSVLLEGGRFAVPMVGDAPITKRTDGVAIIDRASPGYTGQVDVLEGTLQAGDGGSQGYLSFGSGTVNVMPEGRLALSAISAPANVPTPKVRLAGGSLFGVGSAGDGQANLRGVLEVVEDSTIYLLDGAFNRPRSSTIRIDGNIHVASGKTLSVLGRPDTSQGLLAPNIQLEEGAVLAGDGAITSVMTIGGGAVLSPGLVEGETRVGLLATTTPSLVADLPKSRMIWADEGRYRWEINDAEGEAGAPFGRGWDVMRIGSLLNITATTAAPFVIEPIALGEDGQPGPLMNLVPHRRYRWLIAEINKVNAFSATITSFAPEKFAFDLSKLRETYPNLRAGDFSVDIDSVGIHLNALIVPEPTCGALGWCLLGAGVLLRRKAKAMHN